jgi:hypothetical protein
LHNNDIHTLGQLLLTPGPRLLSTPGFGRTSLTVARKIVHNILIRDSRRAGGHIRPQYALSRSEEDTELLDVIEDAVGPIGKRTPRLIQKM